MAWMTFCACIYFFVVWITRQPRDINEFTLTMVGSSVFLHFFDKTDEI